MVDIFEAIGHAETQMPDLKISTAETAIKFVKYNFG